MALSLQVTQKTGVKPTYWKVTSLHVDFVRSTILACVGAYLDKPTQLAGAEPVTVVSVSITDPTQFANIMSAPNVLNALYTQLSTAAEFPGSSVVA